MRFILTLAALMLVSGALAGGQHAGHHAYSFGEPGKAAEASRTISVEANDQMRFVHEPFEIKQGETVRFEVRNSGKVRHEFSIGDAASQRAHALMMKKMPDMQHDDDPSAVTLEPGESKTLVWKFSKAIPAGHVLFACQIPGHFEAGMHSKVKLSK